LVLPQAQVTEKELEEIVKIGMGGREARYILFLFHGYSWTYQVDRALVEEGSAGEMTSGLLGEYDSLKDARMARTPRTGAQGPFIYIYFIRSSC
jgi:pre-mRNA-splicing factor CDC5/CEF1